MQDRQNVLSKWLKDTLNEDTIALSPLAGDASFRRYFRLKTPDMTRVVMDAPPEKETLVPFLEVNDLLSELGVTTPRVHAFDQTNGFALLDDFGDVLLLNHRSSSSVDALYQHALSILLTLQRCPAEQARRLPVFDKSFILNELAIFKEWFLERYLTLHLSVAEEQLLAATFHQLAEDVLDQPQGLIHRDYHSRNIMVLDEAPVRLGIIDFQDAMVGPLTYDLVSLLKDCYVQWPFSQVSAWLTAFYSQSSHAQKNSFDAFKQMFNHCGLQRHLKVLGVFSRLHLRDNKSNYLQDLPLTLHYVMSCLEQCDTFQPFAQFMQQRVQLP